MIGLLVFALMLTACGNKGEDSEPNRSTESLVIKDALGREVEIPAQAEKFVNVGVGSLRLYTYVAPVEKLVGVEENEKTQSKGVPYSIVNHDSLVDLPVIGQGGPKGSLNPEQIMEVAPDVIFSSFSGDVAEMDDLQEQTGIPVVGLSYGPTNDVFDKDLYYSLEIIGKVTREEERAKQVIDQLKTYENDLDQRTRDIKEEDKPSVYVGALGYKGPQGIESTRGNYTLLNALNSINVVDESQVEGSVLLDKEQILEWDPDYIFIDLDGYHIVKEDYQDKPEFYESLTAVKEEKVYAQLPYVLLKTNLETAIADAYYMGTVLYPENFEDIDPVEKADEIYESLLGVPFYEQMEKDYRGFGPLTIGE